MQEFRYDRGAVRKDAFLGGGGAAIALWFLAFVPMMTFFGIIFLGLLIMFGGFLIRSLRRLKDVVLVDDTGFILRGRQVRWAALTIVDLRYYSTRNRRSKEKDNSGWMQLTLRYDGRKTVIDSHLDGFAEVLEHCARIISEKDLVISATTRDNLTSYGLTVGGRDPQEMARGPALRTPDVGAESDS